MKVLRLILFPFTFIFGFVAFIRNLMFDFGWLTSKEFSLPIISVGNLTVGGAGKSPITEYLIVLLKDQYKIATLSRGYGRSTKGYRLANLRSSALEVGDEPMQFKNKFPEVTVAVAEKRVEGVQNLQNGHDLILMDDAYQHRWVKPGFSILLFEYESLFKWQWFLPTGNLREPMGGRKRAHCILVTKCPAALSASQKESAIKKIAPLPHQKVFFSYLDYSDLIAADNGGTRSLTSIGPETEIVLLTGIANPRPLVEKLQGYSGRIRHHDYPDHHTFTPKNIAKIAAQFKKLRSPDKLIITTEKDLQRLKSDELFEHLRDLPVYYLPVKAAFEPSEKAVFDHLILNYVTEHLHHHRIH